VAVEREGTSFAASTRHEEAANARCKEATTAEHEAAEFTTLQKREAEVEALMASILLFNMLLVGTPSIE
jgi:hypothetical protein